MAHKGYSSENLARKELIETYGKGNVTKIAISQQGADYLIICCGEVIKIVEVKGTIKNKYYPYEREKKQIKRIIDFAKQQGIRAELWIYYKKGRGRKTEKEVKILNENEK